MAIGKPTREASGESNLMRDTSISDFWPPDREMIKMLLFEPPRLWPFVTRPRGINTVTLGKAILCTGDRHIVVTVLTLPASGPHHRPKGQVEKCPQQSHCAHTPGVRRVWTSEFLQF